MKDRRDGRDRRHESRDFMMTDGEVARLVKVSPNTVRYWRQTGLIPFVKVGRHPRVWWSAFQAVFHNPSSGGTWSQTTTLIRWRKLGIAEGVLVESFSD